MKHITKSPKIHQALRLLALALLACLLATAMIGCGDADAETKSAKSPAKTAVLQGYSESFWSCLKKTAAKEEEDGERVKATVKEGWSESTQLSERDLFEDEEAYTYSLSFTGNNGESVVYFFAAVCESTDSMRILGARETTPYDDYERDESSYLSYMVSYVMYAED